jgi:hypothetical protein
MLPSTVTRAVRRASVISAHTSSMSLMTSRTLGSEHLASRTASRLSYVSFFSAVV